MLQGLLITLLVVSGILFIFSVLFMSPKGGLGMGIAGMGGGGGEYGSKKSIEGTLRKVAIVTSVVFVLSALFLPYV